MSAKKYSLINGITRSSQVLINLSTCIVVSHWNTNLWNTLISANWNIGSESCFSDVGLTCWINLICWLFFSLEYYLHLFTGLSAEINIWLESTFLLLEYNSGDNRNKSTVIYVSFGLKLGLTRGKIGTNLQFASWRPFNRDSARIPSKPLGQATTAGSPTSTQLQSDLLD